MSQYINLSIELLETNDVIGKKILQAIADEFNTRVTNKISIITAKIQNVTISFLKSTDTYQSLIGGELAVHFGLPAYNRQLMVDDIINKIASNINVEVKPVKAFGSRFVNGVNISVLIKDFSDILSLGASYVLTEKGQSLPWLEWLLIKGDTLIISDHEMRLIPGKGRSGAGVMIQNTASAWRVPAQYSGTLTDNWLTRAFNVYKDIYLDNITKILQQELA